MITLNVEILAKAMWKALAYKHKGEAKWEDYLPSAEAIAKEYGKEASTERD